MPYGVSWKQFGRDFRNEVKEDNVTNGAAALAYYLMLAIFPAMLALLSLIPYLPIQNLDQALMDLIRQGLPGEAANTFTGTIEEVTTNRKGGLLSVGLLLTLWAAANGTFAVMQQLNITYDVRESRSFWKARGTAILLTLMMGVLVIGAFALVVLGGELQSFLAERLGWSGVLRTVFQVARWGIIASFLLLAFAVTYYFGPDVKQRFRFITPGSVIGGTLMVLASVGFKLYVDNFGKYSATYGSIGAVIVLMLWLNILGLVILLGSEVNALIEHYRKRGRGAAIAHLSDRRRQVMPEIPNTSSQSSSGSEPLRTETFETGSSAPSGSVGSVLKEVGMSVKDLVQSEIDLMKAEMKESSQYVSRHLTQAIVFGVVAAISVLPFLSFLVIGLGGILGGNYWLSSLIVGIVCVGIGAPLAIRASKKIRNEDLRFEHTRGGIERGREAVQEGIQDVKDSTHRRAA